MNSKVVILDSAFLMLSPTIAECSLYETEVPYPLLYNELRKEVTQSLCNSTLVLQVPDQIQQ